MRIYGYKNVTQLEKSKFWGEIKGMPHFCVAEVLTVGMKNFYGREKFTVLSTIDMLTSIVFQEWCSVSNDIKRYKDISLYVNDLKDKNVNPNLLNALSKNKRNLLEAVKYLFETEEIVVNEKVNKDILYDLGNASNEVQDVFKNNIFKEILNSLDLADNKEHWRPDWVQEKWINHQLPTVLRKCIIEEIRKNMSKINQDIGVVSEDALLKDFENLFNSFGQYEPSEKILKKYKCDKEEVLKKMGYSREEIEYLRKQVYETRDYSQYNKLIFHGIYRLKPIHVKLFKELEKAGFEVILLNCYNSEFKKVYGFWKTFYREIIKMFEVTSSNIVFDDTDGTNHRKIGTKIGQIIEGKDISLQEKIQRSDIAEDFKYEVRKLVKLFEDNREYTTDSLLKYAQENAEYKDIVVEIIKYLTKRSKVFIEYDSTMQFVQYVSERFDETKDSNGKRHIGMMKEQFYGANGTDMNSIFQVFYPDEFGQKPFFSYPIGQFILSLYNMWDTRSDSLIINDTDLIECLNLDGWIMESPHQVYEKIRFYIGLEKEKKGLSVEQFIDRIDTLICIKKNNKEKKGTLEAIERITALSLSEEQYENFKQVIYTIERIANKIFKGKNKKLKSKDHYLKMIATLNEERGWKQLSGEEKKILDEIEQRLLANEEDEIETDLDTIKDTLTYYMKHNIGNNISWLVRDLDQIEGDILSEAARVKKIESQEKCYHFALLSNENMLDTTESKLPWPLTEDFVSNKENITLMNVVTKNNVKYKRCLLFQGLYYLINDTKIKLKLSYIRYQDDKIHTPYYLLEQLLDIIQYKEDSKELGEIILKKETNQCNHEIDISWDKKAKEIMSCCPYKFMYSYGLKMPPEQYTNELQVKFYCGMLIKNWIIKYAIKVKKEYPNLEDEKFIEVVDAWVNGASDKLIKFYNEQQTEIKKEIRTLPDTITEMLGAYLVSAEVTKLINNNYIYLLEQRIFNKLDKAKEKYCVNMDVQLNGYWYKKTQEYELFKNEKMPIQIKKRIDYKNDGDKYINEFLLNKNEGMYFNKFGTIGEYKIMEDICKYCSFKETCLYSYRADAKYLLRESEKIKFKN